jgi:hypothetical protein
MTYRCQSQISPEETLYYHCIARCAPVTDLPDPSYCNHFAVSTGLLLQLFVVTIKYAYLG